MDLRQVKVSPSPRAAAQQDRAVQGLDVSLHAKTHTGHARRLPLGERELVPGERVEGDQAATWAVEGTQECEQVSVKSGDDGERRRARGLVVMNEQEPVEGLVGCLHSGRQGPARYPL